jgi:hypothetical protein
MAENSPLQARTNHGQQVKPGFAGRQLEIGRRVSEKLQDIQTVVNDDTGRFDGGWNLHFGPAALHFSPVHGE